MAQIGVITEQNDLGLGFDPLNAKDQLAYNEAAAKKQEEEKKQESEKK